MLIRFGVENFLSFKDRQELSLVASSLQDMATDLLVLDTTKLLPAAIIYGANASGKSNLIPAMNFLRESVLFSHDRGRPDSLIQRSAFALDEKSESAPTKLDIDFVLDKTRYHYGFIVDDRAFREEWLYAFPAGKKQTWFYRESKRKQIYFGKNLRGALRTIESLTRRNSLFLSVAAQNAHKQLTPIYQYIGRFAIKYAIENRGHDAVGAFLGGKIDPRVVRFLQHADTGIIDTRFEGYIEDVKQKALMQDIFGVLKKHSTPGQEVDLNLDDIKIKQISFGHMTKKGPAKFLKIGSESSGTLRLVVLLEAIFKALDNGSLVVIDELDASLHTYLSERIVSLFNAKQTNRRGAQLIATTHDTNLLSRELLRRDQVWFTEKDSSGATVLYPLTDIRTRNTDNIGRGYLQGRFGAVPFRGPTELLADSDE